MLWWRGVAGELPEREPDGMIGGKFFIAIGGYEDRAGSQNTPADAW